MKPPDLLIAHHAQWCPRLTVALQVAGLALLAFAPLPFPALCETSSQATAEVLLSLIAQHDDALSSKNVDRLAQLFTGSPEEAARDLLRKWRPLFQQCDALQVRAESIALGVSDDRAAIRQRFVMTGTAKRGKRSFSWIADAGTRDCLLLKETTGWRIAALRTDSDNVRLGMQRTLETLANDGSIALLDLVAELRGDRWRPLRAYSWSALANSQPLAVASPQQKDLWEAVGAVLDKQRESGEPGAMHLLLQRRGFEWDLLRAVWCTPRPESPEFSASLAREQEIRALEKASEDEFASGEAHLTLARALASYGLFGPACREYELAQWFGTAHDVSAESARATKNRKLDPERVGDQQSLLENLVGVSADHPLRCLGDLRKAQAQAPQHPLPALELAAAYARLGEDNLAQAHLHQAQALRPYLQRLPQAQRAACEQLASTLVARLDRAALKPRGVLRSDLFVVRFDLADPNVPSLLAALEAAKHVIYHDFAIPMNLTEVTVFPSKEAFQRYSQALTGVAVSEFAGGYTFGGEMVVYSTQGPEIAPIVAHEYGHVAARCYAGEGVIPAWLSEGIACAVQGGYWKAAERCREAYRAGNLLPMADLLAWQVEGERGFLAYSEANLMVDYVVERLGRKAILNVLEALRRGLPADAAFQRALGVTQEGLFRQWVRDTFVNTPESAAAVHVPPTQGGEAPEP